MNTPNPLVPQGTMPARGKSTFFFKVMMIVSVHVVLIGGMLLQGCGDKTQTTATPPPDTSAPTADTTLPPVTTPGAISNAQPAVAQNTTSTAPVIVPPVGQPTQVTQAPPVMQTPPPAVVAPPVAPATGEAKEYVIAAGDTLGAIAHKNGISLKTLLDANAGVNPKKLQIGQKIQIPGGAGAVASATSPGAATPDAAAGAGDAGAVYTVKSGDTLSKIAKANHTTVKKIVALNDLKTTAIKVSQKLKLPAPKTATAETPAPAVVPLQTPPPVTSTAATAPTTTSN